MYVFQLYNILFGRIMKTLKFTQHNRKYYNAEAANHIKEYNLSVWPGYVTAVDEYESGVLLQVLYVLSFVHGSPQRHS